MGVVLICCAEANAWGFFAHRLINRQAVFLLPPEMMRLFKPSIDYLTEQATVPDSRRYMIPAEGPRHFIDLDHYGRPPYNHLILPWPRACERFSEDSLQAHGIVPWWIQTMLGRLTRAFCDGNKQAILKAAAELGHYVADAHVPLHACSNHNGQKTGQQGIHGFWESRIPELLAEAEWDFFVGKASYIMDPFTHTWKFVLESAAAADTVLAEEARLSAIWPANARYAWEIRNGALTRQYSRSYARRYNEILDGMVERRLRESIHAVASYWLTAWVNAGQPDLAPIAAQPTSEAESREFEILSEAWKKSIIGKSCE